MPDRGSHPHPRWRRIHLDLSVAPSWTKEGWSCPMISFPERTVGLVPLLECPRFERRRPGYRSAPSRIPSVSGGSRRPEDGFPHGHGWRQRWAYIYKESGQRFIFAFYSLTGTKLTYRVTPCQLGPDCANPRELSCQMNHPSVFDHITNCFARLKLQCVGVTVSRQKSDISATTSVWTRTRPGRHVGTLPQHNPSLLSDSIQKRQSATLA